MDRIFWIAYLIMVYLVSACQPESVENVYSIQGVSFTDVTLTDDFWSPKIETNRMVTIPASFAKCEEMGRMDNFLIAGGVMEGTTKGLMPFDDSDVYKILEGAAYSLATAPDPVLEGYVDSVISIIATGQEADGYLTTWKTINPLAPPAAWCPPGGRWENLSHSHELYNSGHLFEAAAAHFYATGKSSLLDIATKNADLLVDVFGSNKKNEVPGHQIVETGLIKLYQISGKKAYLDLARQFLDLRGDSTKREIRGAYSQDHMPVIQQDEAVGHAVRAAYMYAGMTDIAALYKDKGYADAVERIWENVTRKKFYITGGIGARHQGEAFGDNYELPNLTAYNETCAAIANVYWNHRMFLLFGDAKYIDVLERSLYNGVISGVGLDGKSFFYPNPLECDMHFHFNSGGSLTREPWFDCSCCPTNLCRFMPSVPGYVYAYSNDHIYVNLFVRGSANIPLYKNSVRLKQETDYPRDGKVSLEIYPDKEKEFTLSLRIPGWTGDQPVPGDLYRYEDSADDPVVLKINGEPAEILKEKGFAVIRREWKRGDVVEFYLPLKVRRVKSHESVRDNQDRYAIERGPLVYCAEENDNPDWNQVSIAPETKFITEFDDNLLNGVDVIKGVKSEGQSFRMIPYYAWNNRGANRMMVWLPYVSNGE